MEKNYIIIIVVIIAVIALFGFLIYRNHKDKKDLMKTLIGQDQVSIPKERETEIDLASEK